MTPTTTTRRRGRPKKLSNLKVDELVVQGEETLTAIIEAEKQPADQYRRLAELVVELRQRFQSPNREIPDWAGRSKDYREAITRMYATVAIPPDSEAGVQARIRYHVSNRVREVAPAEDLTELGLSSEGSAEKAKTRRASAMPAGMNSRADLFRAVREAVETILPELPLPAADTPEYVDTMKELVEAAKLLDQLWAIHERRRDDVRNRTELLTTYQLTRLRAHELEKSKYDLQELRHIRLQAAEDARALAEATVAGAITAAA